VLPPGIANGEPIRRKQACLIHRNVPAAVIGGFLVMCLVVAVFSKLVPVQYLMTWMTTGMLLSA
jgi:Na+/glutamate symporter